MKRFMLTISISTAMSILAMYLALCARVYGATAASHTLILPVLGEYISSGKITSPNNIYAILVDMDTGYLAHSTTGATSLTTTWSNAAIEGTLMSDEGIGGTNTFCVKLSIPPLNASARWLIAIFENATPADTDTPIFVQRYSPNARCWFGDSTPVFRDTVLVNR